MRDDLNNAECEFDGGDCCVTNLDKPIQKDYYKKCKSLDPSPKPFVRAACGTRQYRGDGDVYDDHNNAEFLRWRLLCQEFGQACTEILLQIGQMFGTEP